MTILTVLATALALWVWPRREGQWLRANANQFSKDSMETGRKAFAAARKKVEAAKSKLGFSRREPERSVLAPADAGLPRSPELGQNVTLQGGVAPPQIQAFELTKTSVGDATGPAAANSVPRAGTPGTETEPGPIFSAADRGVEPPVFSGLRPPWQVPAGVRVHELPEYDIVVSAAGLVESVKLISSRPGVRTGMELSVIKAWRFVPATLGGQPVRYRLRVRLQAQ